MTGEVIRQSARGTINSVTRVRWTILICPRQASGTSRWAPAGGKGWEPLRAGPGFLGKSSVELHVPKCTYIGGYMESPLKRPWHREV